MPPLPGTSPDRDQRIATTLPSGTLEDWDRAVNEVPLPNTAPNRTVLVGAGGRPATHEELIDFVRQNNARIERERARR